MNTLLEINFLNFFNYYDKIDRFFKNNKESENVFHPHELSCLGFYKEIKNKNKDKYFLLFNDDNNDIISYGLIRGFDEGYKIPSIGLLVDKNYRSKGYGEKLLNYIHSYLKMCDVDVVRLTVEKQNHLAISLYNKYGYVFKEEGHRLIGFKNL